MRIALLGFLLLSLFDLVAQDHYKYLGARLDYGYVIIHSRALREIKNSYPRGLEIDLGKHTISEKAWNSCNCFPKSGVSLTFWDFDNQRVLGYGITGMYYLQPTFGASNKINLSVRAALGLSYQSRPYDKESNTDNQSYSTYVAFPLQLGSALHFRISPYWNLDLNFVYNHISNGGMKEPNKGINWPTVGLGVSRYFTEPIFPEREKTSWRTTNLDFDRLDFFIFSTYHQPRSFYYLISMGIEVKYSRRISRINNLTVGSEWMYDSGQADLSTDEKTVNGNNVGVVVGHEFILGDFLFGQQFATYLIRPQTQKASFYQRYSLVYKVFKSYHVGVALKAHGHVADFVDIRVGYSF